MALRLMGKMPMLRNAWRRHYRQVGCLLACSGPLIQEPSLPDGMGDDVVEGVLPCFELTLAVDQDILGDAKWPESFADALQLRPAGALRSELLIFHNEQVDIRVGGLIPPRAREPKR